jgi:hypothetical protein
LPSSEIAPVSSYAVRSGPLRILSWSCSLPRSLSRQPLPPHWFSGSSSSLAFQPARRQTTLDLEVCLVTLRSLALDAWNDPPTELNLLQSLTTAGGRTTCMLCSASHEVCGSFSTTHLPSPQIPGLPHPVRSAYRVSHPLDGLLLDRLPGLVSCRSAHGVPALRAFPSLGAVAPLDARFPPAVDSSNRPTEPEGPACHPPGATCSDTFGFMTPCVSVHDPP